MSRSFNEWLRSFKKSISSYDYYANFNKVISNVENAKIELNILNALIGSDDIEEDFKQVVKRYPETLKCIPILLAVREYEIFAMDEEGEYKFDFKKMNHSLEEYSMFMRKTGLFDMLSKHLINNLVDYVYGVETGLDSNGRKNRGGHLMEDTVERYLVEIDGLEYYKELKAGEVEKKWGIDLSPITNAGKTIKRFDFVVKVNDTVYAIETNFYASQGSKLNETARSYKLIAQEASNIKNFEFVWVTDGQGWNGAKNNLRETFEVMEHIYNIEDLNEGMFQKLFG